MQYVKKTYLICFLLLLTGILSAQERHIRQGDEAAETHNFVEAVEHYNAALPAIRAKGEPLVLQDILYKIGDAYLQMNQFGKALPWLRDAVDLGIYSEKLYLSYAKTLTLNAMVDKALEVYTEIWTRSGNTLARKKIAALKKYDDQSTHFVNLRNEFKLNSKFSDYSPAHYGEKLVFSSARPGNKGLKNKRTAQGYSNLYEAAYNSSLNAFDNIRPLSDKINTSKSEGVFAFSEATGDAYWMQCLENNTDCRIMVASRQQGGLWSTPRELLPLSKSSTGHPTISKMGRVLYFVSDMPGGFGGKDIWRIQQVDRGRWTLPQNLGPEINTQYDELFPSIFGDTLLFFASDRPASFGGMDIYYSEIHQGKLQQVKHPGYPFNTVNDDFGVLLDRAGGLFTSNRNNIAQSDDIFSFDGFFDLIYVKGKVIDSESGQAVAGAALGLAFESHEGQLKSGEEGTFFFKAAKADPFKLEVKADGYLAYEKTISTGPRNSDTLFLSIPLLSEQPLATIRGKVTSRESGEAMPGEQVMLTTSAQEQVVVSTSSDGMYVFKDILPGKRYEIKVAKEGYFSESRSLIIPALETPALLGTATGYDTDFRLTKIQKEKEVVINNIFYDFNKATLRSESKKELNKLLSMLHETPNVIIQINSHTDVRGSNSYNQGLSQRRAQRVVDYLSAHGISADRLFARGYGEEMLLVKNARTETQHQLNRRTAFKVLAVLEEKSTDPLVSASTNKKENYSVPEAAGNKSFQKTQSTDGLDYRVQIMASSKELPKARFQKLTGNIPDASLYMEHSGEVIKYEIGTRATYKGAVQLRAQIVALGHKDCFITAYQKGQRISIKDALKIEKK